MSGDIPHLTPAQIERLAYLSEELGEAQQAVAKILRHGWESSNPLDPDAISNQANLETELSDVWAAMRLLASHDEISLEAVSALSVGKLRSIELGSTWFHHNPEDGP